MEQSLFGAFNKCIIYIYTQRYNIRSLIAAWGEIILHSKLQLNAIHESTVCVQLDMIKLYSVLF